MKTRYNVARRGISLHRNTLITAASLAFSGLVIFAGCASDDAVGHTKTTEKKVIDTPTEKTTVIETHEKDTTYSPR